MAAKQETTVWDHLNQATGACQWILLRLAVFVTAQEGNVGRISRCVCWVTKADILDQSLQNFPAVFGTKPGFLGQKVIFSLPLILV